MGDTKTVFAAILFTDIVESVRLERELGTQAYAAVLRRHGELFDQALGTPGTCNVEKNTGDGFMVRFGSPSDAVTAALRFQWYLRRESWKAPRPLRVRCGIHEGEIMLINSHQMPSAVGTPVNLAARVQSLAQGGQVLMTRGVFDNARQFVRTIPNVPASDQAELAWQAHGTYLLKGIDEPIEIFEAGEQGFAPFTSPESGNSAKRSVSAEEEATLGWRPAKSLEVPKRHGWYLQERVGEGGFGEVWLAQNRQTSERRVFKFCFDVVRLRSFKRELLLFRMIREALGPRRDIVTLYEVQIESAPFFLESEYCSGGTLKQWFQTALASREVEMVERLEIVARVARALAAAHSLGIIHKDVKPSNIFIEELEGGRIRPRLADFGIGVLIDRQVAADLHLTLSGGLTVAAEASHTGTRMYSAPEYMIDWPPSVQGDIYSLGVLLFQILVGDFNRPLGPGWKRDIQDPLLVEDIAMCVDVEPQRRFSSALQLATQIETLDERRSAIKAAEAASRQVQEQQRQLEVFRRRVRLGAIGSAVAIALIGALGALVIVLDQSRKNAEQHAADLKVQQELAEDRAYLGDMQTVTDDTAQRRGEMTREIVERYRPKAGERDRRGWEWFYVDSVLNTPALVKTVSKAPLRALAVSPDEKHVAVGGDDGEISLWTTATLEKVAAWRPAQSAIRALSWKSSGGLAVGLENGEVSIAPTPLTSAGSARWLANRGAVTSLDWHPQRDQLATGGADGRLAVRNARGDVFVEARKDAPIHALAWQPEGNELAVLYGKPLNLVVASPAGIQEAVPTPLKIEESPLAWRPGGSELAIAMEDVPVRSWNPRTGVDSFALPDFFSAGATAYAWSPNGDGLAVGGVDGKILLLDAHGHTEQRLELYGHKGLINGLRWLGKDGERLVSAGQDGTLRAWPDLRQSQQIVQLDSPDILTDAQWHPRENKLARLIAGDEVQIVHSQSGETQDSWLLPPPREPRSPYRGGRLAWSPDGKWLAAVCPGRPVAIWNAEDRTVRVLPNSGGELDVQWMPDSRRLLLRGENGWSWCAVNDQVHVPIAGTEHVLWMGAIEGEQLGVVSRAGGTLRFSRRNLEGGATLLDVALPVELGSIRCAAFNANRSMLALGGETGAVAWVDTRTGGALRPAITHAGPVRALGWHPHGTRLATVGVDSVCRIFNIDQVAQTWVIAHKLQSGVVAAGWSADGRRLLLCGSTRGMIRIYDASLSMDLARGASATSMSPRPSPTERACAAIAQSPDAEEGWQGLAKEIRLNAASRAGPQGSFLLAALELAMQGHFSSDQKPSPTAEIVQSWEGVTLPVAAQVVQACMLRRWEHVLQLCGERGEPWFLLARAEALLRLDKREEGEAANLRAWQTLRRQQSGDDKLPAESQNRDGGNGVVDLSAWANIKLTESWSGGDDNSLSSLPSVVPQPEGFNFHTGDFLQLASRKFRITGAHMLPRSTGWISLPGPTRRVAAMLGACRMDPQDRMEDMVIGSMFLLRSGGRGAVRVPLVYGRNIWDWWSPAPGTVMDPPHEAIAWRGESPLSSEQGRDAILSRVQWETSSEKLPFTAIAFVSHMRKPAVFVVAVTARP